MNLKVLSGVMLVTVLFVSGCTTATYGNKFESIGNNEYTLKIYTGGASWAAGPGGYARIQEEADKFLEKNPQFKSYEIIDSRKNYVPSYFEYTVKFSGEEK